MYRAYFRCNKVIVHTFLHLSLCCSCVFLVGNQETTKHNKAYHPIKPQFAVADAPSEADLSWEHVARFRRKA